MIHFEMVTPDNFNEVINLKLKEEQVGFMLYYFQPDGIVRQMGPGEGKHEMHYMDNDTGASLYESVGFASTGEVRRTLRPGTEDKYDEELVRRMYY